jgi:SAM-dependent methyltransferase
MYQESLTNMLLEDSDYDKLLPNDEKYMLHSPIPVGYSSISEQQYIFQNLIIGYDPELFTILDIGSGRGDLFGFIKQIHNNKIISYKGLDYNKIMCNLAKEKYDINIQNKQFESAKLDTADWVVASGFFTQRRFDSEDKDLHKLFDDVDKMYQLANNCVSFNLLSPIGNEIVDGFFYVHPGLVMDMLIEKYRYVTIRANYSNDVYTVTIYKF